MRRDRRLRWIALAVLLAGCGGPPVPTQVLRRPGPDLLAVERAWVTLSAEGGVPRLDVVTPSIDNQADAADRTALLVPPSGEVELMVGPDDGEGWIHPVAGVDLALARRLLAKCGPTAAVTVTFELARNGATVARADVTTHARAPQNDSAPGLPPHVWHPLGDPGGIPVRPGDRLALRTRLAGPLPAGFSGEVPAGFAGLQLERRFDAPRTPASDGRPNLLWIVVDTLRRDRTSAFGYERPTTPRLAELASRGVVYDGACATSSWTWPSVASLFTGRPPEAHGVVDFRSCWLEDELTTLAESLQEAGFTTGGFSGNPLVSELRNFDQGFETFLATRECAKGEEVVPPALEWLRVHRDQRFFLYVHLHDPHVPHRPRPEDLRRFTGADRLRYDPMAMQARTFELRNARAHTPDGRPRPELLLSEDEGRWYSDVYDAEVASADWWVGVVLDGLSDLGLDENTFVAFTADHGEELLDHGMLNHNHALWRELVRVPLVLAGPGLPAGRRVATPVSNRHLAPTLARLLDVPFPAQDDFLDLSLPDAVPARPVFFDTRHGWWNGRQFVEILGMEDDGWVLHWCPEGLPWDAPAGTEPAGGEVRLFDLRADPGERVDRSAAEAERVARMRAAILRERARLAPERPASKRRAGEATLEMLRAAGYAGGDDDR